MIKSVTLHQILPWLSGLLRVLTLLYFVWILNIFLDSYPNTVLLTYCISYFHIVVIKYHYQDNLQKEGFNWFYSSRRSIHNGGGGMAVGEQGRQLRDYIFNSKHKAGKENCRWVSL